MDAAMIHVLCKLFGLGIDAWDGFTASGLDSNDLRALNSGLALAASAGDSSQTPGPPVPDEAGLHLALVVGAFARAFERHWVGTRAFEQRRWYRRWISRDADRKRREDDIEARLRMAQLIPQAIGERADSREIADVARQAGNPLGTCYYCELWRVFSDPKLLVEDGDEPPLDLSGPDRRAFERHFLLAYEQALRSPTGQRVARYLGDLEGYRARVVQELLVADVAGHPERSARWSRPSTFWPQVIRRISRRPLSLGQLAGAGASAGSRAPVGQARECPHGRAYSQG